MSITQAFTTKDGRMDKAGLPDRQNDYTDPYANHMDQKL